MKIRDVKIKLIDGIFCAEGYIVMAIADIYIKDGFRICDVRVVQHRDKSLSLEFENQIVRHPKFEPWTPEARRMIERIVITCQWKAYHTQHNVIESTPKPCYNTDTE